MDIQDIFFQLILVLVSPIIGIVSQMLGSDQKKLKILLTILAIFLLIIGIAWITIIVVTPPPTQPTPTPSNNETSNNWNISYEYRFPAGFWANGSHQYTFDINCPNVNGDNGEPSYYSTKTYSFNVSENATLLAGDVYLRIAGLKYGIQDPSLAQDITQINPSQTTTASIGFFDITKSEAEVISKDCLITIAWDGNDAKKLTPSLPFQQ